MQKRSTEDLKERYYSVCNRLTKVHTRTMYMYMTVCCTVAYYAPVHDSVSFQARNPISYDEGQLIAYDAPHERRRKLQLERLLNR